MSQPPKKPDWSNEPKPDEEPAKLDEKAVPSGIETVIARQTPRDLHVAALAERMKNTKPQSYDIKSKNPKALRVIHDVYGDQVSLQPGAEKRGVVLWPHIAEYLGRGDLEVTASTA